MSLVIELLGSPRVVRDAAEYQPRGRKSWGLLAYLLLADRPPSRERLAELLFAEADDPLGTLRWNLSELRRVLGSGCTLAGDPIVLALPPDAIVDIAVLSRGSQGEALELPGLGRALLEGVSVSGSAAFELWLANARRRLDGATEAVLHEAALDRLAAGHTGEALAFASRLVELNPLDEAPHVLLVQCLHRAGQRDEAAAHVARCTDLFWRELGTEPSTALKDAAATPALDLPRQRPYSLRAMLEGGEAAVAAGAVTQGVQTLRAAAALARQGQDPRLLAQVLIALGRTLVQAGRGGDEEGGAVLHEAIARAADAGDALLQAAACRELAFADLQRGRYDRVRHWVRTASALATDNDQELAWIEAIEGARLSDQGRYGEATTVLTSALERAQRAAAQQAAVFARGFTGRLHLLRRELPAAAAVLETAVRDARVCWMAFSPWLDALLAEVELRTGNVSDAEARLERAFVMGRQMEDACVESIATRGLGLVAVARGRLDRGYALLVDAPRISRRLPDSYLWIEGYGLDALCDVAVEHFRADAPRWVAQLEELAARCAMRELLARATLHRARLGEPGALEVARELIATIDNPALRAQVVAV